MVGESGFTDWLWWEREAKWAGYTLYTSGSYEIERRGAKETVLRK